MSNTTLATQAAISAGLATLATASGAADMNAAIHIGDPATFGAHETEYVFGARPIASVGTKEASFPMARIFSARSDIVLTMSPASNDGASLVNGAGAPPTGGSGGGDDDDPKVRETVDFVVSTLKSGDAGAVREVLIDIWRGGRTRSSLKDIWSGEMPRTSFRHILGWSHVPNANSLYSDRRVKKALQKEAVPLICRYLDNRRTSLGSIADSAILRIYDLYNKKETIKEARKARRRYYDASKRAASKIGFIFKSWLKEAIGRDVPELVEGTKDYVSWWHDSSEAYLEEFHEAFPGLAEDMDRDSIVHAFIGGISHKDEDIRKLSTYELAKLAENDQDMLVPFGKAIVDVLLDKMTDPEYFEIDVASAIATLSSHDEFVPYLLNRLSVIISMATGHGFESEMAVQAFSNIAPAAIKAMPERANEIIESLIVAQAHHSHSWDVYDLDLDEETRAKAVPIFFKLLKHEKEPARIVALRHLGNQNLSDELNIRLIKEATGLLKDSNKEVRAEAAKTLAGYGPQITSYMTNAAALKVLDRARRATGYAEIIDAVEFVMGEIDNPTLVDIMDLD
jgi:hypothetical protein